MNSTEAPVIRTHQLRRFHGKGKDRFEAVRRVDLEVHRGELFALLGTNGAGKTSTLEVLEGLRDGMGLSKITSDDQIGKVTLVGAGMKSNPGVAAKMFDVLAREGINIQMIGTSEIKISVVIAAKYAELAVRSLHDALLGGESRGA